MCVVWVEIINSLGNIIEFKCRNVMGHVLADGCMFYALFTLWIAMLLVGF